MNKPEEHHHDSPAALRAEALEQLLTAKGLLTAEAIDNVIEQFQERVGPLNGARIVARAWTDPDFRGRLLEDGTRAIEPWAFEGGQVDKLVVVANEPGVHNVVVCTLCSCYPWALLGLPPKWYKDPAYRSGIVRQPRRVLAEMGLQLPEATRINVWDSSAEIRYLVLPEQPSGTEGMSEEELTALVTRDAMIGVAVL
ncbi:MAG: nitrile hydratase subunit alpha [Pseudomonadales bacterium]|nr:nitrile hydratase subunit alpha [Pseudomonadales bacterium]